MSNISWECKQCGFLNVEITKVNEIQKCLVCKEECLTANGITIVIKNEKEKTLNPND